MIQWAVAIITKEIMGKVRCLPQRGKCIWPCSAPLAKHIPPPLHFSTNGNTVPIVKSMTLLGITLSPSLKWDQRVEGLICRANCKRQAYFLVVLRRAGVGAPHLTTYYTVLIHPVSPHYATPVWQPELTQELSDDGLERVQRLCLQTENFPQCMGKVLVRTIYPELSYTARRLQAPWLQAPWLQAPWLQAPWLQAPWLQAPWLQAPWLQAPWLQ